MQILIAEDNLVAAHVLQFNLDRAGFEVHVVGDGCQALQVALDITFDMVITDYQMPGMDGAELCRNLRTHPNYVDTPIVVCSAKGYEIDTEQLGQELNVSEFVCKPFSPARMVELVKRLTAEHCPARS